MKKQNTVFNSKQMIFKELFVGTLIYAVVLGCFDDYTDIVAAKSFSTIFLAAILLEVLTYRAFVLKGKVVSLFRERDGRLYRFLMVFFVWLIMFSSKFVFIWSIDWVFGDNINIVGFFGILYLVLAVTIIHKLADEVFKRLGDTKS